MLPNMGYFRSIECPSFFKEGVCKRPYCHFRHSSSFKKVPQTKGKTITICHKPETKQALAFDESDAEDASNYKTKPQFPNISSKIQFQSSSIDYSVSGTTTLSSSDKKSVLLGAKGVAPSNANSRVKYDVSIASKPVDDLEYDPMSNFNLKSGKSKRDEIKEMDKSSSDEVVDLTEDDASDSALTIDDNVLEDTNLKNSSDDELIEYKPQHVRQEQEKTSTVACDNNVDAVVVISDSEPECTDGTVDIVPDPNEQELEKGHSNLVDDLFGTDSENDVTLVKEKQLGEEFLKKKPKKHSVLVNNELKKFEVSKSKLAAKKDAAKSTFTKAKAEKNKLEPSKEKPKKKNLKRKRSNDTKTLFNEKRKKTEPPDKTCDVGKYVSKDEIEKLDRELLNDVGKYDECYQIYQETLKQEKPSEQIPVKKPAKEFESTALVPGTSNKKQQPESSYNPPVKNRRVAHTSASQSARNLNRDRKQTRRLLTPAQAMIQRMETIKQEQEERILSSLSSLASASQSKTSSENSISSGSFYKTNSTRTAHQPSPLSSQLSLNKKTSSFLAQRSLKKPFQDLRSKPSSTLTTQTTLLKGYKRKAHAPSDDLDIIEKPKILPDRHSKVPTNVRQRYLNVFIEECVRIFGKDKLKAYETAKTEESQCNSRSKTKAIYLNLAASTLKRLRAMILEDFTSKITNSTNESTVNRTVPSTTVTTTTFKTNNLRIAHNIAPEAAAAIKKNKITEPSKLKTYKEKKSILSTGFSIQPKEKHLAPTTFKLYQNMCRYLLTDEQLGSNGFPRPGTISGTCAFEVDKPKVQTHSDKKTCARCGKEYFMSKSGFFFNESECVHHWGKAFSTKVGSQYEKRYSCCQTPSGSEGCTIADTHVHKENTYYCSNYVKTFTKINDYGGGSPGIYALDCEMAFTVVGLELIRVSVVNFDCELVYDTLVQPEGKILDCNTRWSGLTVDDLKGVKTTLKDVQAVLLNKFSSDTILLGHSLESDLVALRLVHSSVVDTSVVFPHRLGPPFKRALRNLMAEKLGIIIQNSVEEGHDSMEDASACVKLMKWKLEEDLKVTH